MNKIKKPVTGFIVLKERERESERVCERGREEERERGAVAAIKHDSVA